MRNKDQIIFLGQTEYLRLRKIERSYFRKNLQNGWITKPNGTLPKIIGTRIRLSEHYRVRICLTFYIPCFICEMDIFRWNFNKNTMNWNEL